MSSNLPVTIKKEHSIKEASITLFLTSPIIKPERFKEVINDPELKDFFQQHQPLGEINFKLGINNEPKSEVNVKKDAGFKLLRFENGAATFVVQGINEIDRTFFSFHSLNYTRWDDFIQKVKSALLGLNKIQNDIFINGISLHYIDEFIWDETQEFDLSRIMKSEDFLPKNFIKIKGGHLSNTRECETLGNQKLYDRLEVLVNSNIEKGITISHNQTVLIENVLEYKDPEGGKKAFEILNELHSNNKELLRKILLTEVKNLIKLN